MIRFALLVIITTLISVDSAFYAQVVSLPCQSDMDGVFGLDRKAWGGFGNSNNHSQGSLHNFTLPLNTFGPCKRISNVEVEITVNSPVILNLPPGCNPPGGYFTNVYYGCGSLAPASCGVTNPPMIDEPSAGTFVNQNYNYAGFDTPITDFDFGETFSIDIVPVVTPNCAVDWQLMLTNGYIVLDFDICVTVTIQDLVISAPVDLGPNVDICDGATTPLDAGNYDMYAWDPNGETSQIINVGPGNYTVTVTDINGCTDTDDITINGDSPTASISSADPDLLLCPGETTVITASHNGTSVLWSSGETTDAITVGSGTYTVEVTDLNGCTGTESITLSDHPLSPITFAPAAPEACVGGTATITVVESYGSYQWSNLGSGQSISVSPGIYTVTITDANLCTNTATVTVTSVQPPNAGSDNLLQVCNDNSTYDIQAQLAAHDAGGSWNDDNSSGIDINTAPSATSFLGLVAGTYTYTYTVTGNIACPPDDATITVEVFEANQAGINLFTDYCEDPGFIDFMTLISNPTPGGFWDDLNFSGVDLSDPTNVNLDGVEAGIYSWEYLLFMNGVCPQTTTLLTIEIIDTPSAGQSANATVCEGAEVDLFALLGPDASLGGFWVDVDGSGGLVGEFFQTTGLAGSTYRFSYEVQAANGACGSDIAFVDVTVSTSVTAGISDTLLLCQSARIDIVSQLVGADPGGTITALTSSAGLLGTIVTSDSLDVGTYVYEYSVGDDIVCPSETSTLTIEIPEPLTSTFNSNSLQLCAGTCQTLSLELNGSPTWDLQINVVDTLGGARDSSVLSSVSDTILQIYVCDDGTPAGFSQDTLYINEGTGYNLYVSSLSDLRCPSASQAADTVQVITVAALTTTVDTMLCSGDTILISGVPFAGTDVMVNDTLSGSFCDSIVTYLLTFDVADITTIADVVCAEDTVTIGGVDFTSLRPSDTLRYTNVQGCDSTIIVDLNFLPPANNLLGLFLCEGDFIEVNGVRYDESNTSGTEILEGQSSNGCDSIVVVALSFSTNVEIMITDTLCTTESITRFGQTYDITNASDNFTLTGAGCDTIVTIDLSFFAPATATLDTTLCDGASITVGIDVYDANNLSGITTLVGATTDGCDSVITVTVNLRSIAVGSDTLQICEGDSVQIAGIWQSTAGVYPTTLSSVNNCDSTLNTVVIVNPCSVAVAIGTADNTCFGQSAGVINLTLDTEVDTPYRIVIASGTSSDTTTYATWQEVVVYRQLATGTYTISILDAQGAIIYSSSAMIATLSPEIMIDMQISQAIDCYEGTGALEANISGGLDPFTVDWGDPALGSTSSATAVPAGTYTVTVSDMSGCTSTQSVTINEPAETVLQIQTTTTSCSSASDGSLVVTNVSGGVEPYSFTLDGVAIVGQSISGLPSGQYDLVATDANLCSSSQTITIVDGTVDDLIGFQASYTIVMGDSVELSTTPLVASISQQWSAGGSILCVNCPSLVVSPPATTTYEVIATDSEGCTQVASIRVIVEVNDIRTYPNIFSPNGDGSNEDFMLLADAVEGQVLDFYVYDRWGSLMYRETTTESFVSWDGRNRGNEAQVGVYVYVLQVTAPDGSVTTKTGDVAVIR